MHYQCESLIKDCKDAQGSIMMRWSIFAFFMIAISQPVLFIVAIDLEKELSLPILLTPLTTAWAFLIVAQIVVWYKVQKYYKRVITLCKTQPQYQLPP